MKMARKTCDHHDHVGKRAWKLLRMALLWARKGGVFKHGLLMDQVRRINFPKSLKIHLTTTLGRGHSTVAQIHYFERELSFDKTPLFGFRTSHRTPSMRFNIPCLKSPLVLQDDYDQQDYAHNVINHDARKSFLSTGTGDEEDDGDLDQEITLSEDYGTSPCSYANYYEDEAVDRKADEFIAQFYQQMKLQRQISYLQYNERLNIGTT